MGLVEPYHLLFSQVQNADGDVFQAADGEGDLGGERREVGEVDPEVVVVVGMKVEHQVKVFLQLEMESIRFSERYQRSDKNVFDHYERAIQ